MKTVYLTFRSVTHGQRGERLLRGRGIPCNLTRTPRWMEARGCGYSLRLSEQDALRAAAVLRNQEVPLQKAYRQAGEGVWEEMAL